MATWRILTAIAAIAGLPAATACSADFADPSGDQAPPGMPGQYDLVGLHLDFSNQTLTWTWVTAADLPPRQGELFIGQMAPPDDTEQGIAFHPECTFYTATDGMVPIPHCRFSWSEVVGGAVSFRYIAELNGTVEGARLSVAIPLSLLALDEGDKIRIHSSSTQLGVGYDTMIEGSTAITPIVTDDLMAGDKPFTLCAAEDPEAAPGEAPSTGRDAPLPWLLGLLGIVAPLVGRRRA